MHMMLLLFIAIADFAQISVIEIAVPGVRSPKQRIPPDAIYEEGLNDLTPVGSR